MEILLTFIILLAVFGFLVLIHEAGHFIVAKINGVQVDEFAFGFGPRLIERKIGDTVYKINLFPLGGYVKMLGDNDGSSFTQDASFKGNPRSYIAKSVYQKMSIILAGPLVNFIGAAVIFFIVLAMSGFKPDPLAKIVDYKFLGAQQKELIYYNYLDKSSPLLLAENTPQIGFVMSVDAHLVNSFIDINRIIAMSKKQEIGVVLVNRKQEEISIAVNRDKLLGKKNPLGIALIDQSLFHRMNLAEYWDYTPVFYNGLIVGSNADKVGVPHTGFIISVNGNKIDKESAFAKYIEDNVNKEISVKIMDIFYNVDTYKFNVNELGSNNGAFYVALDPNGAANKSQMPHSGFITSINDIKVEVSNGHKWIRDMLVKNENKKVSITIKSMSGSSSKYMVQLGHKTSDGRVLLGIFFDNPTPTLVGAGFVARDLKKSRMEKFYLLDYNLNKLLSGLYHAINITSYQVLGIGKLIGDAIGGQPALLLDSVGTPIKIGEVINSQVVIYKSNIINKEFLLHILDLTGLLSATLAFMNMLPIPLVDGGQFMLLILEKFRGKPLSERKQELLGKIGFIFLIGFSIIVLSKDFWQVILSKLLR